MGALPRNDGMCAAWVIHDGKRLRRRSATERERYQELGGRCPYGCGPEHCAIAAGPDPEAELAVRRWQLCGGRRRWCWPRAGALADQDAVEVAQFLVIDGLVGGSYVPEQEGGPEAAA